MISKISFASMPKINFTGRTENPVQTNLERSPKKDSLSFGSIRDAKMSDEEREYWNTHEFEFKLEDGTPFVGTVKEFLEASVIRWNKTSDVYTIYHNLYTTDDGKKILNEGLDWTKNRRQQAGPGTYFSPSPSCGFQYGLSYNAVTADYIGDKKEYPVMEPGFYDRLKEGAPISAAQYREIMMDDIGADFIYSGVHGGSAYVVLNDKCMRLGKEGNW